MIPYTVICFWFELFLMRECEYECVCVVHVYVFVCLMLPVILIKL